MCTNIISTMLNKSVKRTIKYKFLRYSETYGGLIQNCLVGVQVLARGTLVPLAVEDAPRVLPRYIVISTSRD